MGKKLFLLLSFSPRENYITLDLIDTFISSIVLQWRIYLAQVLHRMPLLMQPDFDPGPPACSTCSTIKPPGGGAKINQPRYWKENCWLPQVGLILG